MPGSFPIRGHQKSHPKRVEDSRVGSLSRLGLTRLERTVSDKQSSFFSPFVNYGRKIFAILTTEILFFENLYSQNILNIYL
jgi:hypothetical protein